MNIPCWVHCPKAGEPFCNVLWANKAAVTRFGRLLTSEERKALVSEYPQAAVEVCTAVMTKLYNHVVVNGENMSHRIDPKRSLKQMFTCIRPEETAANLSDGPFSVKIDGQPVRAVLSQLEDTFEDVNPDSIRASLMQKQSPIHSYLFDSQGRLLLANLKAVNKWHAKGVTDMTNFRLQDLLQKDGHEQPEAAASAIKAIFSDKRPNFRMILPDRTSTGSRKSVLYELWPATDAAAYQPAMLVNTLNVSQQKELEAQLEDAKEHLFRQNTELQAFNAQLQTHQEKLQAQQMALRAQLKQALQLARTPKTAVDTVTLADKAVSLLDSIIEGAMPELQDIMDIRNAMIHAVDFRQPLNLGDQLLKGAGLSTDVGQAMMDLLQGDQHSSAKRQAKILSARSNLGPKGLQPTRRTLSSFDNSRRLSRDVSVRFCGGSGEFALPQEQSSGSEESPHLVHTSIVPVTERLLQEASTSWTFDIFSLAASTNNMPMSTLAFYLIKGSGLVESLSISEHRLATFLCRVEAGYVDNPYHSRVHAAGVLQMMHLLMRNGLVQTGVLDSITELACYMAACCHDHGHLGLTNDFLIKSHHNLALTYNDISPLENFHAASSFQVLHSEPETNFTETISQELQSILRASFVELILSTDMKKHFSTISRFQAVPRCPAASRSPVVSGSHPPMPSKKAASNPPEDHFPRLTPEQKLLIIQVALKASDLGHLAASRQVHQQWTSHLTEEFFQQGDRERSLGMKISPLMDRNEKTGMIKSQVGFFEIVALPLLRSYVEVIPDAQPMLDGMLNNYEFWRSLEKT
ncbi:hypothetical protein WJX74_001516 [Apatococcus lobatus]|uniref:PDEase domain-containing protein n=1 Tax=Apatococcus lobatus TaxID=904363 RepID=A0AAW1QX14_9CHLO